MNFQGETIESTDYIKIRRILTLTIPAMIENLLQTIVGFVDMLFVSKLGLIEVTSVGISNKLLRYI